MQPCTHGLSSWWNYVSRIISDIKKLLMSLKKAIHQDLIPALFGHEPCAEIKCELLFLPVGLGGLGLISPVANSIISFSAHHGTTCCITQETSQRMAVRYIASRVKLRDRFRKNRYKTQQLNPKPDHSVELGWEKGSSSWLTALSRNMISY